MRKRFQWLGAAAPSCAVESAAVPSTFATKLRRTRMAPFVFTCPNTNMSVGHCFDDEDEKHRIRSDNLSRLYPAAFHQSENPQAARTGNGVKVDIRPNFSEGKKSVGY